MELEMFTPPYRWLSYCLAAQLATGPGEYLTYVWVTPPLPCETEPTLADITSWIEPAAPSLMPLHQVAGSLRCIDDKKV